MLHLSSEYPSSDSTERSGLHQDIETDTRRQTTRGKETFGDYDFLSSELDATRIEFDQIKKETDLEFEVQKLTPKSQYAGTKKAPASSIPAQSKASVRTKIPAPSQKVTATVLQRTHENEQPEATAAEAPSLNSVPSTSPNQVRERESNTSRKSSHRGKGSRRLSHANTTDNARVQAVPESVSGNVHGEHKSTKSSSASPSGDLSKGSPHFAQPTVAAVIRRETVRRDSAIYQGMTTPEGSPKRSARCAAPRQPKRTPLPGGWTDSQDPQSATANMTEAPVTGQAHGELETQPGAECASSGGVIKQEQSLRKKTSTSYMSPTKATTLRNMATMGQENTKRTSPRVVRARPNSEISTAIPPVKGLMSAGSIVSDSGSEKIITEMTTNNAAARPNTKQASRYVAPGSKSPAGIIPSDLRRRMTVGVSVADVLAQHARSSGLPIIGNTTRKRCESMGELLNPIRARLNKVGLLSGGIYQGEVADPSPVAMTNQQTLQDPTKVPGQLAKSHTPVAEDKPAFEPPHRRILAAKAAEAMKATAAAGLPGYFDNQLSMPTPMPMPSLRATAAEFMPMSKTLMSKPSRAAPTSAIHDWQTAVKFRTDEEWALLSPDDRRLVQAARHFERTGSHMPGCKVAGQRHWQTIIAQHLATQAGPLASYADVYGTGLMSPFRDLGADRLQWNAHDTNSGDGPIHFGQGTPSPMPRSVGISPRRAPISSPSSWTIGADANNRKTFGWTGGAGREIKFVGYGPDAERDPYTPVSFNFRGGNSTSCGSSRNEAGPRMIGHESHDGSPQAPLAPRSKAQWAKLKRYAKVPCRDVEITHAVEMLPAPGPVPGPGQMSLAGYCNGCAVSSH